MKTWLVKLTVDVVAYVKLHSDWPEDVVKMLATEAISLFPPADDTVTLEVQNITVDDIVEIHDNHRIELRWLDDYCVARGSR